MKELAQIFLKQVRRKTAKQEDTDREEEQEEGGANSQQPQDTHTQPATHTTQTPPTAQTPSTSPIPSKAVSHNQSDTFVKKLLDEGWNNIALNISTHLDHSTTAYVIDTGGQPEFHAILPLLLRGPALYLLFFNLAESLDKCYNVKYTMRDGTTLSGASTYTSSYSTLHTLSQLLNSFASNRGTGAKHDLFPIAVLLATHLDLVTEETLKEVDEKLREVFSPDDLEKVSLLVHDAKEAGFDSIFAPINNKDGTGIEAVQRFLLSVIRVVCPKPVPVAILWLLFHFILRFHYEEQHVCSFDDCVELAMNCGIEKQHVARVLSYIHRNLGTILYYDDIPTLNHLVICNPEILFKCISQLICRVYEKTGDTTHRHGEIPAPIFKSILDTTIQESKASTLLNAQYVIDLMRHFNIVKSVEASESQLHRLQHCGYDEQYFMPCLLRPNPSTTPRPSPEDIKRDPLVIAFVRRVIPVGLVSALVIELGSLQRWSFPARDRYSNHFKLLIDKGDFIVELVVRHSQLEFHCQKEEGGPVPGHVRHFIYNSIKSAISKVMALLGYNTTSTQYLLYCPKGHVAALDERHVLCSQSDCPYRSKATQQQLQWFTEVCTIILCIL